MNKLLILTAFIASGSWACDPVKYVEKGSVAPCTGYLFTPEKEKEVRLGVVELDYYKSLAEVKDKQVQLVTDQNALLTERYELWRKESDSLSKDLSRERNNNFWKATLYFVLGVAATTGITYAVNH